MAAKSCTAVGSAPWISAEIENITQLLDQEKEEIVYPAQHEVEWLNEHMAEVFSRHQFNVTDVFKTPGKLRGKTPRTARKRNAPDARIPLSDIFSSNARGTPTSAKPNKFNKHIAQFAIAQDAAQEKSVDHDLPERPGKSYTDSGYHGSSQDEMDVDAPIHTSAHKLPVQKVPVVEHGYQKTLALAGEALSEERRTTEGSFHSAKEEQTAKVSFAEREAEQLAEEARSSAPVPVDGQRTSPINSPAEEIEKIQPGANQRSIDFEHEFDDIGSPSDGSTPDRPLVRKSSLTFASLPAREPLKRSMGGRTSRTSQIDSVRVGGTNRNSTLARQTGGQRSTLIGQDETTKNLHADSAEDDEVLVANESDADTRATRLHNKSSTQRLHEKIDMLGMSQTARLSKSIPSAATLAASHLKQSEAAAKSERSAASTIVGGSVADDEDNWIKPLNSPESEGRPALVKSHTTDVMERLADENSDRDEDFDMRAPELIAHEARLKTPVRMSPGPGKMLPGFGHTKSASTATLVSPGKAAMAPPPSHVKTISVSNPPYPTTTPQGSPKRLLDGPLSVSKSKLQSIMKTAKGLFTSSAGVSAAAKLETLSPNALRIAANNMPGLYPNLNTVFDQKPLPPSPPKKSRKTRSSSEREKEERKKEKEAKAIQKMDDQLEKAREKEKQKATQYKRGHENAASSTIISVPQPTRVSPRKLIEEQNSVQATQETNDMAPPAMLTQSSKLSRPTKPVREPIQKPKPQPVAIRVGTLSQRMPITTSSLASNLQETLPSAEAKRPGLVKKASNASLHSSTSNPSFKASVSSQPTKPKALLQAERKKEQDEREMQRKLEQKREIERKRAAQQEELRRQEQRQRVEAERKERERIAIEQAKRAAQQQAIEKKRLENTKKMEQQRNERVATDTVPVTGSRPPSRLGAAQPLNRSLISHPLPMNTAKPLKRPLEEDAGPGRQQAPKFGAASQQADSKRRRTEDENVIEVAPRPTMSGAPIRQSNLGKKPSIFNHAGYAPAPAPPHLNPTQAQLQHFPHPPNPHRIAHPTTMAQYANGGKIPFADAPNPPSHLNKTPAPAYPQRTLQLVKSSPQYPNGEAIHLPEIPTDSEDEDSGDEGPAFPVPSWATPGHLNDQLLRQEGIEADAVFGPIAPLKMEEIFAKGNKDRLKRMRERTSSANWAISGDGLTLEEVRIDREQRERMRLEGGWRYGT